MNVLQKCILLPLWFPYKKDVLSYVLVHAIFNFLIHSAILTSFLHPSWDEALSKTFNSSLKSMLFLSVAEHTLQQSPLAFAELLYLPNMAKRSFLQQTPAKWSLTYCHDLENSVKFWLHLSALAKLFTTNWLAWKMSDLRYSIVAHTCCPSLPR